MTAPDFWRSPLDPERVMQLPVAHWQENEQHQREEQLTVEEPLEIRLAGHSLAIIMRTPGHDSELAAGFLFSEGIIKSHDDILSIEDAVDADGLPLANVLDITLRSSDAGLAEDSGVEAPAFQRHFAVSASCGLCGKNSIADLLCDVPPLIKDGLHFSPSTLYSLPSCLREQQDVFSHTGGLHAAGLFSAAGELLLLREDIGRHNAVDKLVGHGLLQQMLPYNQHILLVSGRTSFEIIQKALLARIPCIAAISAPSSLAVELADSGGITLVGFLRDHAMNVYTHPERILY